MLSSARVLCEPVERLPPRSHEEDVRGARRDGVGDLPPCVPKRRWSVLEMYHIDEAVAFEDWLCFLCGRQWRREVGGASSALLLAAPGTDENLACQSSALP